MNWRCACIWSSWLFLPMAIMLGLAGSKLGIIYAASAFASYLYHRSKEEEYVFTDHFLAWVSIGVNFWLALNTESWIMTGMGAIFVIKALDSYEMAKNRERKFVKTDNYEHHHTMWHFWCGVAGVFLVLGYKYNFFRGIYENYSKGLLH